MIKYFAGIIFIQCITVLLTLLYATDMNPTECIKLGVSLLIIAGLAAFWFSSLSELQNSQRVMRLKERFAKERERLKVTAERDKTKVVKSAQQQIANEARRTHTKANFKVGAAFASAIGVGFIMLLTELLTIGLLTMTTAGGALGGYLYRSKRLSHAPNDTSPQHVKIIDDYTNTHTNTVPVKPFDKSSK